MLWDNKYLLLAYWLQTYEQMYDCFNENVVQSTLLYPNIVTLQIQNKKVPTCLRHFRSSSSLSQLQQCNSVSHWEGAGLLGRGRLPGEPEQARESRLRSMDTASYLQSVLLARALCSASEEAVIWETCLFSLYQSLTHTHTHARACTQAHTNPHKHTNHTQADRLLGLNIMSKGIELCLHRFFFSPFSRNWNHMCRCESPTKGTSFSITGKVQHYGIKNDVCVWRKCLTIYKHDINQK